jgi:hypothetical protein
MEILFLMRLFKVIIISLDPFPLAISSIEATAFVLVGSF